MFESFLKPPISFPTLTGSIVTFNSQYALPLKSHTVALTATQSGSGTPSPDNVRTIIGYSAINISHSDSDTTNPTVYVINLGGTYYGLIYDGRTGIGTVTHGLVDLGTLNWSKYTTQGTNKTYFRTSSEISDCIKSTSTSITYGLTCSQYVENAWTYVLDASGYDLSCCLGWSGKSYIVIYDNSKSEMTTADFKTAMNGVQLMYPLATPQTIQLPPCPIDTIANSVNNIWADTGDTTLQYTKFG